MVYKYTNFSAADFLRDRSASEIWKTIPPIWTLICTGPPDYLLVDQGSAYISEQMKQNLEASCIIPLQAPVESSAKIGSEERYHDPLRSAYMEIRSDMGAKLAKLNAYNWRSFR